MGIDGLGGSSIGVRGVCSRQSTPRMRWQRLRAESVCWGGGGVRVTCCHLVTTSWLAITAGIDEAGAMCKVCDIEELSACGVNSVPEL